MYWAYVQGLTMYLNNDPMYIEYANDPKTTNPNVDDPIPEWNLPVTIAHIQIAAKITRSHKASYSPVKNPATVDNIKRLNFLTTCPN